MAPSTHRAAAASVRPPAAVVDERIREIERLIAGQDTAGRSTGLADGTLVTLRFPGPPAAGQARSAQTAKSGSPGPGGVRRSRRTLA